MGINVPLTVEESDGSPSVTGVRTIKATNMTVTNDGNGVVTIDSGPHTVPDLSGSISAGQIAYGSATDVIAGSPNFVFAGDSTVQLVGSVARFYLSDSDSSSAENQSLLMMKSGSTSFLYDRMPGSNLRLGAGNMSNAVVIDTDEVIINEGDDNIDFVTKGFDASHWMKYDASQGTLVITNDGSNTSLQLFSLGTGTVKSPVLDFYSRNAKDSGDKLGAIKFTARPDGGGVEQTEVFGSIEMILNDDTVTSNDGQMHINVVTADTDVTYMKLYQSEIQMNKKTRIFADCEVEADFRCREEMISVTSDRVLNGLVGSVGGQIYFNDSGLSWKLTTPLSPDLGASFSILPTAGASTISVQAAPGDYINGVFEGLIPRSTTHTINKCVCYKRVGTVSYWSLGANP